MSNSPEAPRPGAEVRACGLAHRYGRRTVFAGVSFEARPGTVTVISGPNGSGKSTMMRIAAGLLTPSEGTLTVRVDGRACGPGERRTSIGCVSPDLTLYRELTAAENLEFFGRLRGVNLGRHALIPLLTRVGLRGRGRDLVSDYSSGMRQRLKFAFALLGDPPILLLDEPTANLDTDGIGMVEKLVADRRSNGGTTIVATNEPRELLWADDIVRLGAGG